MKPRLLVVTEFTQLSTGYSTYAKDLIPGLINGGCDVAEMACFCNPEDPRVNNVKWDIYPVEPPASNKEAMQKHRSNPQSEFGADVFESILLEYKPTHVLAMTDPWMIEYQKNSPFKRFFNWIIMPAVDATPQDPNWIDMYRQADAVLGYTDWGLDVLNDFSGGKIKTIKSAPPCPSGYYKKDKSSLKRSIGLGDDIFIVGTVMRNQRRKLFPNLFKSFRKFLDETNRSDIFLYCHTGYPDLGWDIPELIIESGLSSKVILTYQCVNCGSVESTFYRGIKTPCMLCPGELVIANSSNPISTEKMNNIYNMFDFYVQYANCEGFGMPQVEAALCGIPVASTDYSAMSDVIRKVSGYPIRLLSTYKELETGREMAIPDDSHLIEILKEYFSKSKEQRDRISDLVELTTKSNYNLNDTVNAWIDAIKSTTTKEPWNSPPRISNIPNGFPSKCSNTDFAKFLIIEVLNRPELLGTYLESRILRDLNEGITKQHFGGVYLSEMSTTSQKQIPKTNREGLFRHFSALAEKSNMLERVRCGL